MAVTRELAQRQMRESKRRRQAGAETPMTDGGLPYRDVGSPLTYGELLGKALAAAEQKANGSEPARTTEYPTPAQVEAAARAINVQYWREWHENQGPKFDPDDGPDCTDWRDWEREARAALVAALKVTL